MHYELITPHGNHVQYFLRECAEIFRVVHGGVIVEIVDEKFDDTHYDYNYNYLEKKAA